MPGDAASLTTLATVKTELGISASAVDFDDYLTYAIKVASETLSRSCNREFHYSAAWTESVPGYRTSRLIVTHTPVWSVASIEYYGALIDATTYSIADATKGWIYSRWGWRSTASALANVASDDPYSGSEGNDYVITYEGGWVTPQQAADDLTLTRTLPYDLEHAAVQYATTLYEGRGRDLRISQESLLTASVSYRELDETMPPEISAIIRRYKRIGTGR